MVLLSEAVKNAVSLSCPVASLLATCPSLSLCASFLYFLMAKSAQCLGKKFPFFPSLHSSPPTHSVKLLV